MSKSIAKAKTAEFSLECWQKMTPVEFATVSSEFRKRLCLLTQLKDPAAAALVTDALVGGRELKLADLYLRIAFAIEAQYSKPSSLSWAWVALSALASSNDNSRREKPEINLLIMKLLELSRYDLNLSGGESKYRVVADQWLGYMTFQSTQSISSLATSLFNGSGRSAGEKIPASEKFPKLTKGEDALDADDDWPEWTGPAMQVLPEESIEVRLGDDKRFFKPWLRLMKPVPLLGSNLDVRTIFDALVEEFPWAGDAILIFRRDLEFRLSAGLWPRLRPTLLVGPPGTGKTRLVKRMAALLGVGYGAIAAGGSSDARSLAGTAKGWSGANPSFPLHVIRRERSANPIIMIDELDKAGGSERNGYMKDVLLAMVEPTTAKSWPDEALQVSANFTGISWIATANNTESLKGPLLSRFRVIEIGRPAAEDFNVVYNSIVAEIAGELGIRVDDLPCLAPEAMKKLEAAFAGGWPIRKIRMAIESAISVFGSVRPAYH